MHRILAAAVTLLVACAAGSASTAPATGSGPARVVGPRHLAADLDRDGRSDEVSVWPNVVRVAVSARASIALLHVRAASVAVVDIDADGDQDLVAAEVGGTLALWRNDGAGAFSRIRPRHHRGAAPFRSLAGPPRPLSPSSDTDSPTPVLVPIPAAAVTMVRAGPTPHVHRLGPSASFRTAASPRAPPLLPSETYLVQPV
jgi:hypothetical protein